MKILISKRWRLAGLAVEEGDENEKDGGDEDEDEEFGTIGKALALVKQVCQARSLSHNLNSHLISDTLLTLHYRSVHRRSLARLLPNRVSKRMSLSLSLRSGYEHAGLQFIVSLRGCCYFKRCLCCMLCS